MEEKILIESKLCKKWFLLPIAILLLAILIFVIVNSHLSIYGATLSKNNFESENFSDNGSSLTASGIEKLEESYYEHRNNYNEYGSGDYPFCKHTNDDLKHNSFERCTIPNLKYYNDIHPTFTSYLMCRFNARFFYYNFKPLAVWCVSATEVLTKTLLFFVFPLIIISILLFILIRKNKIVITDKRAYGKTVFGQRVDLPMDSISAIGTGVLKSMYIGTSSGRIRFSLIENCDEIHSVVSELLTKRQQNEEKSQSADELKKYKELLDSGIITQEEFDTKKKQILGL